MSLHDWQVAAIQLLQDPARGPAVLQHHAPQLTQWEHRSLADMDRSRGLDVTREVRQWWRQARLKIALPFGMRLVQRLDLGYLLEHYQCLPCETLFFLREAQAFSHFLRTQPDTPAILRDMVQFECALHLAKLQRGDGGPAVAACAKPPTHSAGVAPAIKSSSAAAPDHGITELFLEYCPEACMAALLCETSLPDPLPDGQWIQICGGWPRLWRTAQRHPSAHFPPA